MTEENGYEAQKLCLKQKVLQAVQLYGTNGGAYYFFWSAGKDVPEYHEWRAQQEK
ncbi:MAG: hypothetical protein Kow0080_07620 [Candidatus Promineifilaceae bacterium]